MSVNVQARIDLCSLATVAKAYEARGFRAKTRSDLVWQIVEDMAMIAEKIGTERFEMLEDAIVYLYSIGLQVEISERNKRELRKDRVRETGLYDFGSEDALESRRVSKRGMRGLDFNNEEEHYRTIAEAMRRSGVAPMSFETYKKRKEEIDKEAVDIATFAEKEEEKKALLKSGILSGLKEANSAEQKS